MKLLSLGEMPASSGVGTVAVAAVCAVAALALMYAVLEIMNAVYRKKHNGDIPNETQDAETVKTADAKPEVCAEKTDKSDEKSEGETE